MENATVPVIETGTGNCHVYVDKDADLEKALPILMNAKTQRTSVCNACESLLIHRAVADAFGPAAVKALLEKENSRAGHFRPGLLCRWTDALAAKRRG